MVPGTYCTESILRATPLAVGSGVIDGEIVGEKFHSIRMKPHPMAPPQQQILYRAGHRGVMFELIAFSLLCLGIYGVHRTVVHGAS